MNEIAERRPNRLSAYIFSLIANGVLLWVLNALPGWQIPYLLPSYGTALPALNLTLSVHLAMNAVLLFYHPRYFHHLAQVVLSGFSIYALSTLIRIFPVDFSPLLVPAVATTITFALRVVLYVGVAATAIAAIVHAVKFLRLVFRGELER